MELGEGKTPTLSFFLISLIKLALQAITDIDIYTNITINAIKKCYVELCPVLQMTRVDQLITFALYFYSNCQTVNAYGQM